jgi:D-alanyl-D-alanine endopeptidase (penicillin-binding protein 7)
MRFSSPAYSLMFNNTNPLVKNPDWDVRLSKTGFTDEAGRCLVMRAKPDRQELAIVLLNSVGKRTPIGDANRIRKWLKS